MTKLGRAGSLVPVLALAGCTTVVMGGGETGGGIQDPEGAAIVLPGGAGGEGAGGEAATGGEPTGSGGAPTGGGQTGATSTSGGGAAGAGTRIVTIGVTGLEYKGGHARFFGNALAWLAEGRGEVGAHRFLYTRPCDPRTDPDLCQLTDNPGDLQAFHDAVDELGELTYASTSEVSLADYDVVIVNYCGAYGQHAVDDDAVLDYLGAGGRALVAAQMFCQGTAAKASALLEPYGAAWTDLDPDTGTLSIPPGEQTGFLEGVSTFDTRRWTPQVFEPDSGFAPIVESSQGVLAGYVAFDADGNPIP